MTLMGKFIFLKNAKEELLEKLRDPKTTYDDMLDIHKQLRKINLEIQEIKHIIYQEKLQNQKNPLMNKNLPSDS